MEGLCGTGSSYCSKDICISKCDSSGSDSSSESDDKQKTQTTAKPATTTTQKASTTTTHKTTTTQKASTTTTQKSSTTTTHKTTTTTTQAETKRALPSLYWQFGIYSDSDCGDKLDDKEDSGYYLLQGYNIKPDMPCLRLGGGNLTTDDTSLGPWCQWWPGTGVNGYKSCGESPLVKPGSWKLWDHGHCTIFSDSECKEKSGRAEGPLRGCTVNREMIYADMNPWTYSGSVQCYMLESNPYGPV